MINGWRSAVLVALGLIAGGCAIPQGSIAVPGAPNFNQVDARLYRSAQPTAAGVAALADRGIKTVINLRMADDTRPEERIAEQAHGMTYTNFPLSNWFRPTGEQIEGVLALIDASTPPVLIHCQRGADRTGTVVACYRIRHEGWTAEQALAEAKEHGMGWWQFRMRAYVRDFARTKTGPSTPP